MFKGVNCILFTGSSRTDPFRTQEKLDSAYAQVIRPLGAYQIANLLRQEGYTVQVIDRYPWIIRNSDDLFPILERYLGEDTLWIGYSNTFFEHRIQQSKIKDGYQSPEADSIVLSDRGVRYLKRKAYEANPNIKFLVGGAKTWRWSQGDERLFDYYVEGYADEAVIRLTNYLAGKGEKPPMKKNDDEHSYTINYDQKGSLFDFNNSHHHWHESDHLMWGESLPIEIARGCIFKCAYCSFPLNGKKKLDFIRDPQKLIDELTENYEKYGVYQYIYSDDTHNDSVEKLELLYNKVYSKLPFKIEFSTYLRLDLLAAHSHTIELLHASGLRGTFFGIESFNHEANKTVGKGASEQKIWDNLYKCKEVWKDDVVIHSGLIVGLPNDSAKTITAWLEKAVAPDSPIDFSMIAELQIFPKWGRDSHWMNKIELNPDFYGYKFDDPENDWNWTNNTGLTKIQAMDIAQVYRQKQLLNKPNMGWMTYLRCASVGQTVEQYKNTTMKEHVVIRDKVFRDYCDKLLNADVSIHRK